jgi:hypothetical protein
MPNVFDAAKSPQEGQSLFVKYEADVAKNFLDFYACFRKSDLSLARCSFGA